MLDAYIINIIKQKEVIEDKQIELELENGTNPIVEPSNKSSTEGEKRGVVIIDFTI